MPAPLTADLADAKRAAEEVEAGLAILRDAALARGEHLQAHYLLIALRRLLIETQSLRGALDDAARAAERAARPAAAARKKR